MIDLKVLWRNLEQKQVKLRTRDKHEKVSIAYPVYVHLVNMNHIIGPLKVAMSTLKQVKNEHKKEQHALNSKKNHAMMKLREEHMIYCSKRTSRVEMVGKRFL